MLDWDDIYATLRLLIAGFIALLLLPGQDDRSVIDPYRLWRLVN